MPPVEHLAFATPAHLSAWLQANHASANELWVRMYKKASGTPSVTWEDCVVACLAWGWIDGVRRSLDDVSFIQRLTPRRAKSNWSKKNCEHAERLIAAGLMQPVGLHHVEAARADGRWESAYAGSSDMIIADDFLAALEQDVDAKAFYGTLKRAQLFSIYHRIQTAKRPETRRKRIDDILSRLRVRTV